MIYFETLQSYNSQVSGLQMHDERKKAAVEALSSAQTTQALSSHSIERGSTLSSPIKIMCALLKCNDW